MSHYGPTTRPLIRWALQGREWLTGHAWAATALLLVAGALTMPSVTRWSQHPPARYDSSASSTTVSGNAEAVPGLRGALWNGYVKADQALLRTKQQTEAVRSARQALEATSTASPSAAVVDVLTQLQRREAALAHNSATFQRQVDAWTSYAHIQTQYVAGSRELTAVDESVRALQALPNRDTLPEASKALTSLVARRAELQRSLRAQAVSLDRLLFFNMESVEEPPPMPSLPQLASTTGSAQPIPVSWAEPASDPLSDSLSDSATTSPQAGVEAVPARSALARRFAVPSV